MNNTSPLSAVRRRWWIVVLMAMAGGILGALPQPEKVEEQVRTFSATHTLLLNETVDETSSASAISPQQVTLFVTTGEVPERVSKAIGYDGNPATLASQVTSAFDFST